MVFGGPEKLLNSPIRSRWGTSIEGLLLYSSFEDAFGASLEVRHPNVVGALEVKEALPSKSVGLLHSASTVAALQEVPQRDSIGLQGLQSPKGAL